MSRVEVEQKLADLGCRQDPQGHWVICHQPGFTGIVVLAEDFERDPEGELSRAPAAIKQMREGYADMNDAMDQWLDLRGDR